MIWICLLITVLLVSARKQYNHHKLPRLWPSQHKLRRLCCGLCERFQPPVPPLVHAILLLPHLLSGPDRKPTGHPHLFLLQASQDHDRCVPAQPVLCRSALCSVAPLLGSELYGRMGAGPVGVQGHVHCLQGQPLQQHVTSLLHQRWPLLRRRQGRVRSPPSLPSNVSQQGVIGCHLGVGTDLLHTGN